MDIQEIRARHNAATPGPWMWDMRTAAKQCLLVTEHSGQYYVMGFDRCGMQDACPTFQVYDNYEGPVDKRGSHGMVRADKLAKSYPGKEHHHGFDDYINHPDAIFIARAVQDVSELLQEVDKLQAELEQVKAERDAEIADLRHNDACSVCVGSGMNESDCSIECENCKLDCRCRECHNGDKWRWRGMEGLTMACKAVREGHVKRHGQTTIEWYKEGQPQRYCYGYVDRKNDNPLPECLDCQNYVDKAQGDLEAYNRTQAERK